MAKQLYGDRSYGATPAGPVTGDPDKFVTGERITKKRMIISFYSGDDVSRERCEDILLNGIAIEAQQIAGVTIRQTVVTTVRRRRSSER